VMDANKLDGRFSHAEIASPSTRRMRIGMAQMRSRAYGSFLER
jgi:hypothetical protein